MEKEIVVGKVTVSVFGIREIGFESVYRVASSAHDFLIVENLVDRLVCLLLNRDSSRESGCERVS